MFSISDKYDNRFIRRQDRLLDEKAASDLLQKGEYAILSMVEDREETPAGYGIPISYVWDGKDAVYFHCAPDGHKLKCLALYPATTLTVVGNTQVIPDKFTTNYSSIVVRGKIVRGLSEEERMYALSLILDKYAPHDKEIGLKYAAKSFHRTEILRMNIESISGKAKAVGGIVTQSVKHTHGKEA